MQMKALVLTSTSLRHRYFASKMAERFRGVVVLSEEKKDYYVQRREESPAVRDHFKAIASAEREWFCGVEHGIEPQRKVVDDINAPEHVAWAVAEGFEAVCLFGTSILKDGWLQAFPLRVINLHLGLSPFYRGSATLFWPFANRELEYLGTTIHLATQKVDAGAILGHVDPDLRPGENYYQITNRLIRDSIDAFPSVTAGYLDGRVSANPQRRDVGPSRVCRKVDFSEAALKRALDYVGSGLGADEIARIEKARACRYSQ
jgi:folate-dependent phosphoribosylglycinamide formyltransferase PurN